MSGTHTQAKRIIHVLKKASAKTETKSYSALSNRAKDALRLLFLRETIGQAPRGFSAATKTFGTEFEVRVANFCGAVMGPHATLTDSGLRHRVARNICYAPGYVIMGGTTQILRNILGERVLGLPR